MRLKNANEQCERRIVRLRRTHNLHINQPCRLRCHLPGYVRRHPHDDFSEDLEVEEQRHKAGRVVHGLNQRIFEIRLIARIAGLSETEVRDHIHRYATKRPQQIRRLSCAVLSSECGAEIVHLPTESALLTLQTTWVQGRMLTFVRKIGSASSTALAEKSFESTSRRSLASLYETYPKEDSSSPKEWYVAASLSHRFLTV